MRILIIDEVKLENCISKLQNLRPKTPIQFLQEWDLGKKAGKNTHQFIRKIKALDPDILVINDSHVMGNPQVAKAVFEGAPSLGYVIRAGVGTDHVYKLAATEAGVKVINEPYGNNEATAEWALRLVFVAQAQYSDLKAEKADISKEVLSVGADEYQESHEYRMNNRGHKESLLEKLNQDIKHLLTPVVLPQLERLRRKKIGIIGLGNIGRIIAKKLQFLNDQYQLEMEILGYTKEKLSKQQEEGFNIRYFESVDQLFKEADIITIHIPGTEENVGFINSGLLNGSSVELLVNAARDVVVHHGDLLAHLQSFPDFKYYADFVSKDCLELTLHPRVVISDHIAGIPRSANEKVGYNVGCIIETIVKQHMDKNISEGYPINIVNQPPSNGWRVP